MNGRCRLGPTIGASCARMISDRRCRSTDTGQKKGPRFDPGAWRCFTGAGIAPVRSYSTPPSSRQPQRQLPIRIDMSIDQAFQPDGTSSASRSQRRRISHAIACETSSERLVAGLKMITCSGSLCWQRHDLHRMQPRAARSGLAALKWPANRAGHLLAG